MAGCAAARPFDRLRVSGGDTLTPALSLKGEGVRGDGLPLSRE